MKKNNTEKFWWSGLTVEAMKHIDKKESNKKTSAKLEEWNIDGSDIFADVTKSKKKSQKDKKRESLGAIPNRTRNTSIRNTAE